MKIVSVWLNKTSEPIKHTAKNTYQKGSFYCVQDQDDLVYKYPIFNIFRVIEEYGTHGSQEVQGTITTAGTDKINWTTL